MSEIITNRPKTEPNVVPLCDILLVLLIIFMVITPTLQKGIDIVLPEEIVGPRPPENVNIVLSIDRNLHLSLNQMDVEWGILESTLHRIFDGRTNKVIFVSADKNCTYAEVVRVLDTVKGAGIANICMMSL